MDVCSRNANLRVKLLRLTADLVPSTLAVGAATIVGDIIIITISGNDVIIGTAAQHNYVHGFRYSSQHLAAGSCFVSHLIAKTA